MTRRYLLIARGFCIMGIYLNMQQFVNGTENQAVLRSLKGRVPEELWEMYGSYIKNTNAGPAEDEVKTLCSQYGMGFGEISNLLDIDRNI